MISVIREDLLIHEIKYNSISNSTYGQSIGETVDISKVRVVPALNLNGLNNALEQIASNIIYYCCSQSIPREVKFKLGDYITFNGHRMIITKIVYGYTNEATISHIEIYVK